MQNKKNRYILGAILILAALLRLWKLGSIPPGLTPDEASLGYNAYSVLKTAKDEHGQLLPIIFKSFGDYKPGLYVYLTIPFVAFLGLSEFVVRLPSAIAGIFAVLLLYKIVATFFVKKNDQLLPMIAAFMFAISPWHILLSRGAWEVNVSLTFTLAGILLFLKALKKQKYLMYSSIFFALTLLTYQGAKLSTAIVVFLLTIIYWKQVARLGKKNIGWSLFVGFIISLPIVFSFFTGKTGRLEVFSVFSYPRPQEYTQAFIDQSGTRKGSLIYNLFYSEPLNFTRGIMGRWFNHFSTRFLFFEGDWQIPRHSAPNHGVMLLIDIVFLPLGLFALIKKKFSRERLFVILWLVLAPLPAILSRDQVQAVRSYNTVIPLAVLSSFGVLRIIDFASKVRGVGRNSPVGWNSFTPKGIVTIVLVFILFFGSFIYFIDAYFIHLPKHNAKHWFYGYRQAVETISPIQHDYDKIIFQQSYDQPYIYFLFYQKYDPSKYQKSVKFLESGNADVGLVEQLDNIVFQGFSWPHATGEKDTLIVGNQVAIPADYNEESYKLISEIKYPDEFQAAFRIVEAK